ncbi:MAG: SEC-C metal-binding domain-containing protein, partial [Coriobacteriia bacterium]|nr:SEC-C metal-binding domain-containing protein [Coriobacteriia bacterium]
HEARRIDNQLRGRSGRQGDPGYTQFYLSLEDDLMRLFGGERMGRIASIMERTDMSEDTPIDSGMVSKAIEGAQRQVESIHFDSRKHVLEYDDVMNRQRAAIYAERNAILDGKDIHQRVLDIMQDTVEKAVSEFCGTVSDDWDKEGLQLWINELTGVDTLAVAELDHGDDSAQLAELLFDYLEAIFAEKEKTLGEADIRRLEAQVMLRIMDTRWMNHLQEMDYLKAGIGLRAFGQRDPLTEYKNEAHLAFGELRDSMFEDYLRTILRMKIVIEEQETTQLNSAKYSGPSEDIPSLAADAKSQAAQMGAAAARTQAQGAQRPAPTKTATIVKDKDDPYANVGRNDPCPCGSGKKYKKCHGVE